MMRSRRAMIAAAVAAVAGGVALEWRTLFAKHYKPTPYDDVLARLTDRDAAAAFGADALKAMPRFAPAQGAARLRQLLGSHGLAAAAQSDAAAGRTTEIGGWIVPESVALITALAASVA